MILRAILKKDSQKIVGMMMEQVSAQFTLALTIEPERLVGALVDAHGNLSEVNALPNPITESRDVMLQTIVRLAKQVVIAHNSNQIDCVGVVVAAPVDAEQRTILHTPNLAQLEGNELCELLQSELRLPVFIENDVSAMALSEAHIGVGKSAHSLFYIFVDTHLNGAIVQQGQIWRGMHASAGEIRHLVAGWMGTKPISLGQRASGIGIAAEYNMRSRTHRMPSLDEIIQYARQGDHLAVRVIRDGAHILGSVLAPVMKLLAPDTVIVGGRLAHSGDLWWANFVQAFTDAGGPHLGTDHLHRATFDEDAAIQGAAVIAQLAYQAEHASTD